VSLLHTFSRPAVLGSLLAVSVAGNMLLGGVIAGRIGAHAMHPPLTGRDFESRLPFIPEAERREMREQMRKSMPEMRKHWREMREMRESLARELARDTPDRATIERQLAAIRAESAAIQQTLHAGFVDMALKLEPEERKRMLDAMLEARAPGAHHRGPGPFGPHAGGPMAPPPPGSEPAGGEPP